MHFLKSTAGVAIGVVCWIAIVFIAIFFIYAATYFSAWVMRYMAWAVDAAIAICILALPLALFHRGRKYVAFGFYGCSFVFGLCTLMLGLLVTMEIWGVVGVLIGLCFLGVGLVPIGMLASLIHAQWLELSLLVIGVVFTYGARGFGFWMASKYDAEQERRVNRVIEGVVLR